MISGADLIEDDLPTNLDYLDHASRRHSVDKGPAETLHSWQTDDADTRFSSEVNGETIKILLHEPFDADEQYWENLPVVNGGYADE